MDKLLYQPHEAKRHTVAIKETMVEACRAVFPETAVGFRVNGSRRHLTRPAEHVTVKVFQRSGWCRRRPICEVEIDRPENETGMYEYTRASAVLLDWREHAANTRLLGLLHSHCPFLPKIEVTMTYNLQEHEHSTTS